MFYYVFLHIELLLVYQYATLENFQATIKYLHIMPEFCQVDILLAIQQANLSLSNWLSTLFPSTIFLVLLTSVKVSISIDYYISA